MASVVIHHAGIAVFVTIGRPAKKVPHSTLKDAKAINDCISLALIGIGKSSHRILASHRLNALSDKLTTVLPIPELKAGVFLDNLMH